MKKVFILSKRNIALLGLGTVGKAVYEEINNNVSYVLVKDITKKRNIQLSEKIITNDFQEINKTLGYLINDETNTNNAKRQIKNIYSFKKEYLKKMKIDFTEWCNYSLMRCFLKIGKFVNIFYRFLLFKLILIFIQPLN